MHDDSPTTRTIIFPYPVSILVPLIKMGEGTECLFEVFLYPRESISSFFLMQNSKVFFLIGSDSPVIAL